MGAGVIVFSLHIKAAAGTKFFVEFSIKRDLSVRIYHKRCYNMAKQSGGITI